MNTGTLHTISFILVLVGALNWLLVGIFGLDLVAYVFGTMSVVSRIIYILIGAGGIYLAFFPRPMMKKNII